MVIKAKATKVPKVMTPKEFAEEIKELALKFSDDPEVMHGKMDDLLCEVLNSLGYKEGVKAFKVSDKYYA